MLIPVWAVYSIAASLCVVAILMMQERVKANGFILSFWIKLFVVIFTLPLALKVGFPTSPLFYGIIFITAVLYCISDVIYFHAIPKIGSGLITRTMPGAVVISFFIWLSIDHSLLEKYFSHPWQTSGIIASILLAAISASFLKKCHISWQGIKAIWFCIFAASIGPVITKLSLNEATITQAAYSYIVVQGVIMMILWLIYFAVKRPVSAKEMFSAASAKSGLAVGVLSCAMMILKMQAMVIAENPAYVSILLYTDVLWIIVIYKLIGRKETSNIWAGLGIVASAIMLIVFKSL